MPLQATSGAASYDAFGGGVPVAVNYIEDVFSTWLYTGNGSTQTITNGVDLSGKGGLVWIKDRSLGTRGHVLYDTARGGDYLLTTSGSDSLTAINGSTLAISSGITFNSTGFSLGTDSAYSVNNFYTTSNYVSWAFREQPKFFDVVTWTGNGGSQTVNHNLQSLPGCIIYKRTDFTSDWFVATRNSAGNFELLKLNTIDSSAGSSSPASLNITTTSFNPFSLYGNANGATYVAYFFAHNAGGFGLTGTDNVISCGSWTGGAPVVLGYEPQWLLIKKTSASQDWFLVDNMRGLNAILSDQALSPNRSAAEPTASGNININSTGFQAVGLGTDPYIYIAIRRGPMKVPTTGTSVYNAVNVTGLSSPNRRITGFGFPLDLLLSAGRTGTYLDKAWNMRLTNAFYLRSNSIDPLSGLFLALADLPFAYQDGYQTGSGENVQYYWNNNGNTYVQYGFRRAPSFFDVVCFPTAGSRETNLRVNHNLAAVPELIIVKARSTANWVVYTGSINQYLILNSTVGISTVANTWGASAPTISDFGLDTFYFVNTYGDNMVAYLFASCPGVSKVGSFTGTGATQVINCGFTGGARFVLIKATNTTGSWYVWDSARGIVAGNDPYLLLNSATAEVTTTDWVDAAATGFELSNAGGNLVNTNGVSYIFLAIS